MSSRLLVACAALSLIPLYYVLTTLGAQQNEAPDLSRYKQLQVLSEQDFPFGDPSKRLIIVGDIHGQYDHLQTLLTRLSYNNETDKLFHVGDVVTKGPLQGSIDVLSFLSSNGIQGVRGNQDQVVIEWRSWINWVLSEPGGSDFLESALKSWKKAEKEGEGLKKWNKRQRKHASRNSLSGPDEVLMDHVTAKWWRRVPSHLILFSDAYMVANEMPEKDYEYLASLPVRIYVPHAHLFLVHAGLLSHDPEYDYDDPSQPLSKVLEASRIYAHDDRISGLRRVLSPFTGWLTGLAMQSATNRRDHDYVEVHDEVEEMRRRKQERGILAIPLNEDPWVSMNVRSVKNGKPTRGKKGKPWSEIWNVDMDSCRGFDNQDEQYPAGISNKHRTLPCLPMSVVYGHAAARGLDVKRWSFGLDTACAKGGQLTALVLGREDDSSKEGKPFPFGDASEARIVSVNCKH